MDRHVDILAGFILIPYGTIGCFRSTELLRKNVLPPAACSVAALLGVLLIFGGLGLLLGAPVGPAVVVLLLCRRGMALYNQHLRNGSLRRRDLWPGVAPELFLIALLVLGFL
jgi:hypothetical protein